MREILPKNDASATRDASRARVCEGITKRSQVSVACHGTPLLSDDGDLHLWRTNVSFP